MLEAVIAIFIKDSDLDAFLVPTIISQSLFDPEMFENMLRTIHDRHAFHASFMQNTKDVWICPINVCVGIDPWKKAAVLNHWVLLIVDFKSKKIYYFDPLIPKYKNIDELKEVFLHRMGLIKKKLGQPFDNEGWTEGSSCIKHETQKDAYNCGMFVAHYAKAYLQNMPMNAVGNMNTERVYFKYLLLSKMSSTECCFYCNRTVTVDDSHCQFCERKCCTICSKNKYYKYIHEQHSCEICEWLDVNNVK